MTERSRTEYSVINIVAGLGGYVVNILMSFICRVFFTRALGAEYLGVNGLFTDILSMLSLTELGVGTAMIYALYKPVAERDTKKITSYLKMYGKAYKSIGLIIAVLGVALMPFLPKLIQDTPGISESIYLLYALYLFNTASSYFFSYRSALIIAHQRNSVVVTISYVVVIIQNVAQIIVLVTTQNYLAYLIIQVVCTFLTNVLLSQKALKDYPYIADKDVEPLSKADKISLMKNIKALTVTKLSGVLVNSTDNIVITYLKGVVTTGVVSNYSLLTSTLNSLVNQIFTSLSASLGNLNAVESDDQKYRVFKALNLANFWLYGWAAISFVVLANDIVEFFFGVEYVMDLSISIILAINFYMLGMQCVVGIFKSTMGLFRYGQYMMLMTGILNLIGDVILGQMFGVMGIFVATALARMVTNTWYEPLVVYKHGLKKDPLLYLPRYLGFLVVLVGTAVVCYCLCLLIQLPLLYRLIVELLICVIVPNVIFLLVFHRFSEFKYLIGAFSHITNKVLGKIKSMNKKR